MSDRIGSRKLPRKARVVGLVVGAFAALAVAAPTASAALISGQDNPFRGITVSNDLVCQISRFDGDVVRTEFDTGAEEEYCGTFAITDATDNLYGNSQAGPSTDAPFFPVSQTSAGSGTAADPYTVTTVVEALDQELTATVAAVAPAQSESSLLTITQVDTYVLGDDFYRTDVTVHNDLTEQGGDQDVELYHVADCRLKNNDTGFAVQDSGGNGPVFCTPHQQADEIEPVAIGFQGDDHALLGFVPVGTDSHFREALANDGAGALYNDVNGGNDLADLCDDCDEDPTDSENLLDNGVGLSWEFLLPPGGSERRCFYTVDSYVGNVPNIPASCTPGAASNPPATVAQKPPSQCKLRISRARVFLFRRHPRLRLVARYRSAEPADVQINFKAIENGEKVDLGDVTRHFHRHGLFRLPKALTEQESDALWETHKFLVHFKIPGEPGFCERKYKKELTVPRIIDGQRVVFQTDSSFSGGPGHPEH